MPMFPLLSFIPILLFFADIPLATTRSEASSALRLCEIQGTCFKCPDGHFSHFICRSDVDCFAGEFCVLQKRFCCPANRNDLQRDENRTSALCPDGSNWGKMCKTDGDCLFQDELCAEGKCCPSCRQRRLQALRELRSFVSAAGSHRSRQEASDEFIPQCSDDGKHFRAMQCTGHSGECFCVDKFGRRHPETLNKWTKARRRGRERGQRWAPLNCTSLREQWAEEGPKVALSRDRWLTAPERDVEEEQQPQQCPDPLREFRHCGSACPISCATRIVPQCPQEQCQRGCFCRLPYVILDATDPFGSRCVLPAECPLLQFTPDLDQWNGGFFPANQPAKRPSSPHQHSMDGAAEKCRDPLKNFQNCGSPCPLGCGQMAVTRNCPSHCVPGCFCRIPYVLRDPLDPNSECILPQQCPQSMPIYPQLPEMVAAASHAQQCLAERNQSWTGCFSRKCSRSCGEWPPFCVPDDCQTGCECEPPAVIRDKLAPIWECILPQDCPTKTSKNAAKDLQKDSKEKCGDGEGRKEFLQCGSSCPLGCDRLDQPLRHCSPCVAGCFCKNGFVFVNASEWRTSGCVPIGECPSTAADVTQKTALPPAPPPILMPASATTITAIQRLDGEIPLQCSANTLDREGQICQNDAECGGGGGGNQRKCCALNSTAPARCTCRDPNAIWTQCGPLCPEYCSQSGPHLCPGPCRPGCFCPPGYVKRTKDVEAECVPIAQCAISGEESIDSESATANEAAGQSWVEKVECGEAVALASIFGKDGERIGRVLVRPERAPGSGAYTRRIRMNGEFALRHGTMFAPASLIISLHQFSDTTINGCAGVGRALQLRIIDGNDDDGELNDARGTREEELTAQRREDGTGTFTLDKRIEWPDSIGHGTNPLIGHSIVLQQTIKGEHRRVILGCAVLGIAPSC